MRLPYAVAKIAFTINIATIIYYLISHPQFSIMIHFIHKFITVNLGDILWYNVIFVITVAFTFLFFCAFSKILKQRRGSAAKQFEFNYAWKTIS